MVKWIDIKDRKPKKIENLQIRKKLKGDKVAWIVFDFSTALMCILNDVGGEFLQLCDGKNTIEQILFILKENFETNEDQVKKDIEKFLPKLLEQNLIKL